VFTGLAAAAAGAAGDSPVRARVALQLLAALGTLAAAAVVWRATRDAVAVATIAVNPFVVVAVVNGAHNDALVGLGLIGAVLLAERGRAGAAGAVAALAVGIKVVAVLPAAAIAVWVLRRWGLRALVAFGLAGAVVVGGPYLLAGGRDAVRPVVDARGEFSAASPWNGVRIALTRERVEEGERGVVAGRDVRADLGRAALVAVALVAGVVALWRSGDPSAAVGAGAAALAFVLAAAYVLPWYVTWALFPLALRRRSWVTVAALVHGALLLFAYVPTHPLSPVRPVVAGSRGFVEHAAEVLRERGLPALDVAIAAAIVVAAIVAGARRLAVARAA
jgi:hypothetical protein